MSDLPGRLDAGFPLVPSHPHESSKPLYTDQSKLEEAQRAREEKSAEAQRQRDFLAEQGRLNREARLSSGRLPKPPSGYRFTANGEGLEPIPGGPADQKVEGMFNVDTALRDSTHATLDILSKSIKDLQGHSGLNSIFGVRGMIPNIPGTDAADAQGKLNTIKTQLSLKAIADMRASSKTGGAVGQVTEKEWPRLESAFASLEKAQSVESAKQAMDEIQTIIRESKERVDKSFNMKYGDKQRPSPEKEPAGAKKTPHPKAINRLKMNKSSKEERAMFDEVYGEGAAAKVLGE